MRTMVPMHSMPLIGFFLELNIDLMEPALEVICLCWVLSCVGIIKTGGCLVLFLGPHSIRNLVPDIFFGKQFLPGTFLSLLPPHSWESESKVIVHLPDSLKLQIPRRMKSHEVHGV